MGVWPGVQAAQKPRMNYLRKIVAVLTISYSWYMYTINKKLTSIQKIYEEQHCEIDKAVDNVGESKTTQSEIETVKYKLYKKKWEIKLIIPKMSKNIERKFYFDPERTIVATNLPDLPGREYDTQRLPEPLVRDGLNIVDIEVVNLH